MPTLAREAGISQATGHRYLGEPALQALRTMRAFGRSPAADPSLPNMWEDDVRPAMESGRAAYQINWPFVHASMAANRPDMLPHFKWAPTRASPARVRPRWAAATSPSAPTPATPTTLCLRDAESQEIAAIRDGLPPTLRSLYDDPQLARAYPMRQAILDAKLRVQMRTTISRLQKELGTTTVYVTHDQVEAMTLGDRIVIMRDGVVQQVGPPQDLYDHPRNLFVAGFIGSPPMNFLPAKITPDGLRSPLGTIPPSDRLRRATSGPNTPDEVILGIRPEAFEDAELVPDADPSTTFTGTVDILESLGAEKYAFFDLGTEGMARSEHLEALARDRGTQDMTGTVQITTRLDPRSTATEGRPLKVWFNPSAIHLFDPASGINLTEQPRPETPSTGHGRPSRSS
ncbi:sugar ABC transporter ATPase [Thermomonospora curvata]|uniref:ABC-type sugar transport systems ATPase components-like protein n=1 Tax=Thermomonospora curvata (strain ATCC 19995 / DSM 43183 / JCM 3096 / KCTC 9072 / NBRC 15933 / NCIMB 10081 / Henssen B9) TaxID=471852 RepID=D1A3E9_THECD|nr:sugar ABC transporter ATPase [Thermomonospora curvata]ACY96074.1 ABC-type sugar transport systems ATPase components-like protein [Thermomonospora curvata DSM 43183]